MNSPSGRKRDDYRTATRAALIGLGANLALGIGKLTAGLFAGSLALLADAINSLGDVFTSGIVLFGLRFAQKAPNPRHPYGYTRAESIAALVVALMVMLSAFGIAAESLQRSGAAIAPPLWTIWLAAGNVAVKEGLYWYKSRLGKRVGSSSLVASAWDHRGDALCSFAVLIGLALFRWGGDRFARADRTAAGFVALVIVWSAVRLFRSSARELMDMQADERFVDAIRREALVVPEVRAIEELRVRKSGLEFFADIHVEVDPTMTVADGHRIGHEVKNRLLQAFPALRDVLVHLEPHQPAD